MSDTPADDVVQRDRHLRAALRHAPDAQAQPPRELSEAILREAREAVRTTTPSRRWFAVAPMPWAGGFAGLLLATLVGILWWREPLPPREPALSPGGGEAIAPIAASEPAPPAPRQQADEPPRSKGGITESRSTPPSERHDPATATAPRTDDAAPGAAEGRAAAAASVAAESPPAVAASRATAAAPPQSRDAQRAPALADREGERRMRREADGAGAARSGPTLPSDLDAGARAWLIRLDAEAGARWQRHLGELPAGRRYRWPEREPPHVTVVLAPAGAYWRDPAGTWFVALTALQMQRLGQP